MLTTLPPFLLHLYPPAPPSSHPSVPFPGEGIQCSHCCTLMSSHLIDSYSCKYTLCQNMLYSNIEVNKWPNFRLNWLEFASFTNSIYGHVWFWYYISVFLLLRVGISVNRCIGFTDISAIFQILYSMSVSDVKLSQIFNTGWYRYANPGQ